MGKEGNRGPAWGCEPSEDLSSACARPSGVPGYPERLRAPGVPQTGARLKQK